MGDEVILWFLATGAPDQIRAVANQLLTALSELAGLEVPMIEVDPESGYILATVVTTAADTPELLTTTGTFIAEELAASGIPITFESLQWAEPGPAPGGDPVQGDPIDVIGERTGASKPWLLVLGALGFGGAIAGVVMLAGKKR